MDEPSESLTAIIHKLIIARETMPHSRRWEAARQETLFRYLQQWQQEQKVNGWTATKETGELE